MKLRPIQQKTIARIYEEFKKGHKKILVMLPTGSGKTVIAKTLIDSCTTKGNRALFTVPRINLIEQTARYFSDFSIIQGDDARIDDNKLLQIATLQTLKNREISAPNLVIFDEVHYAFDGELIQSVFRKFPQAYFIGLSATPTDEGGNLLEGFDAIIDDYQLEDLINEQWLVPIESYACANLDLSKVRVVAGDYVEGELSQVVRQKPILHSVVDNYIKYAAGKKFICFAVSKEHGRELNELFNWSGFPCAFVNADTPINERNEYYTQFKNGALKGLVNIEILTAGFDEPTIECGIMACPTKSWRKYIQAVGRIVRLNGNTYAESCENGKKTAIFLDCGNTIQEHGLPTQRKRLTFKPKISRIVERELGIDADITARKETVLSEEKIMFLRKIGSLLDLYDGKIYTQENDLQEDVNSFLKKTDWFWWRQNSGKLPNAGRWIHFTSKAGLPDNTVFFNFSSVYIGIELKLKSGYLTDKQKITFPEMIQKGVLLFFAEHILDVFHIIKHIEENISESKDGIFVSNKIYLLPERQKYFYDKFKLTKYVRQ